MKSPFFNLNFIQLEVIFWSIFRRYLKDTLIIRLVVIEFHEFMANSGEFEWGTGGVGDGDGRQRDARGTS